MEYKYKYTSDTKIEAINAYLSKKKKVLDKNRI